MDFIGRIEVPVLEEPANFDTWLKKFRWVMASKLVAEKDEKKASIQMIAALITASQKVHIMEEIVLGEAKDLANPPDSEDILKKLELYFKPHITQQRNAAINFFYHTSTGTKSYRSMLQSFDLLLEECSRASYKPADEEKYDVLVACIPPLDRIHILGLNDQVYNTLRKKLNAMMAVE
eukprot:GHVR01046288.1.p1 GENE.GHVR01046288.1~~GHVR01046288.1.p1  ORF type:complete len:178 (-),score=21.05 GHVR01046288.1:1543-2076(-)